MLKYAFPEGRGGQVEVELSRLGPREFLLVVADDGVGLPKDIDWMNGASLGLRLVSDLTCQLDGRLELEGPPGARFRIRFQEAQYRERN